MRAASFKFLADTWCHVADFVTWRKGKVIFFLWICFCFKEKIFGSTYPSLEVKSVVRRWHVPFHAVPIITVGSVASASTSTVIVAACARRSWRTAGRIHWSPDNCFFVATSVIRLLFFAVASISCTCGVNVIYHSTDHPNSVTAHRYGFIRDVFLWCKYVSDYLSRESILRAGWFFKKKNTSPDHFLLKHFCATRLRDAPCDASSLMTAAIHLIFGLKRCSKKEPSSDEQVLIDVDFWRFQQNYGRKAHVHWMQRATKTKCDVSATNHPPCESQMSGRKFCTGFLQLPETRRLRFSRRAEAETANGIWITQAPG